MKLTHLVLVFAICSYNAIGIPVIYDYDYESWRNANYGYKIQNQSPKSGFHPPRRYRETEMRTPSSIMEAPLPNTEMPGNELSEMREPAQVMRENPMAVSMPQMLMSNPMHMPMRNIPLRPMTRTQFVDMNTGEMDMPSPPMQMQMRDQPVQMQMQRPPEDMQMQRQPQEMQMQPEDMQMRRNPDEMEMRRNPEGMEMRRNTENMQMNDQPKNMQMSREPEEEEMKSNSEPDMEEKETEEEETLEYDDPSPPPPEENEMPITKPMTRVQLLTKALPKFTRIPSTTPDSIMSTIEMMKLKDEKNMRKAKKSNMRSKLAVPEDEEEMMTTTEMSRGDMMVTEAPKNSNRRSGNGMRKAGKKKSMEEVKAKKTSKKKVEKEIEEEDDDEEDKEASESKEDAEDIVPVLRALGLPDDFASGTTTTTTTPKPRKSKAAAKKQRTKMSKTTTRPTTKATTTRTTTEATSAEEDDDDEESEEEEESEELTTTRKPPARRVTTTRTTTTARAKPLRTRTRNSEAKEPHVAYSSSSGPMPYNSPPYTAENPGPGDVFKNSAKWRGVVKGGWGGQVLRLMLNVPAKSIAVMKPLIVGTMDTGGQTKEALGAILDQASKDLPIVMHQAGDKSKEMLAKAGDLMGGLLYLKGGLVNTGANLQNSLSGTLPLLFDGVGDMIGGVTGQIGQLFDFLSGLNDIASEGITKAGQVGGNLLAGFTEGKKEQGKGVLDGIKYGLNNEPIPKHQDGDGGYYRKRSVRRRSDNRLRARYSQY